MTLVMRLQVFMSGVRNAMCNLRERSHGRHRTLFSKGVFTFKFNVSRIIIKRCSWSFCTQIQLSSSFISIVRSLFTLIGNIITLNYKVDFERNFLTRLKIIVISFIFLQSNFFLILSMNCFSYIRVKHLQTVSIIA